MKLKEVALVLDSELITSDCIVSAKEKFYATLNGLSILSQNRGLSTSIVSFGKTVTEAKKSLCRKLRGQVVTKNAFTTKEMSFQLPKTITI